jgi:hypothetical protein
MTDIVERLRMDWLDPNEDYEVRKEAADEIERLRAAKRNWSKLADDRATQVAELRAALSNIIRAWDMPPTASGPFVADRGLVTALEEARAALKDKP